MTSREGCARGARFPISRGPKLSLYAQYAALLDGVLDDLVSEGALPGGLERTNVTVEPPRDPSHGDLATNAAMVLAKPAATTPRSLAELIKPKLEAIPPVTSVDVAGPGFINIRLTPDAWRGSYARSFAKARNMASARSARTNASMSNMCRRTRPGRCTWAIAGAPSSVTALRGSSRPRAFG